MTTCSNFLETELLNHVTNNASYTPTGSLYLALFTNASSLVDLEQGDISEEVSGANYSRQSIVFDAAPAGFDQTQNTFDITFNQVGSGGWGTVEYAAVLDDFAPGTGEVLFYFQLNTARTATVGDTFIFSGGSITLTIT